MLPAPLRGIVTPLITPLLAPDALDVPSLARMVEHVIAGGMNGIFLLGTTGEGPSLSYRLREELVRQACALVNSRVPVLVAVSDTALEESNRMAAIAADSGAAAVVLAPPYYFQYSQTDLLNYVELAAHRFALPLFLYNIPQLTKVAYEPETVARAAQIPGVLGLKDSSYNLEYLGRVIEMVREKPDFSILTGPEEILLDTLKMGCHGGICGGSNLRPELFRGLYQAFCEGRMDQALLAQESVLKYSDALYRTGFAGTSYLRGLKCALELAGLCRSEFAPPLTKFTKTEYLAILEAFQSLRTIG